jgi:hypothetical protein
MQVQPPKAVGVDPVHGSLMPAGGDSGGAPFALGLASSPQGGHTLDAVDGGPGPDQDWNASSESHRADLPSFLEQNGDMFLH